MYQLTQSQEKQQENNGWLGYIQSMCKDKYQCSIKPVINGSKDRFMKGPIHTCYFLPPPGPRVMRILVPEKHCVMRKPCQLKHLLCIQFIYCISTLRFTIRFTIRSTLRFSIEKWLQIKWPMGQGGVKNPEKLAMSFMDNR